MSDNERFSFDELNQPAASAAPAGQAQPAAARSGLNSRRMTPIFSRNTNTGIVKELKEGLDTTILNAGLEKQYQAIIVEGNKLANKRPIDIVALVFSDVIEGTEYMYITPVLFELRNGMNIPDKVENLGNGIQRNIHQYTEDMIGASLARDMVILIKAMTGKNSARAYVTPSLVFPASMNFSKEDLQACEDWASALSIKIRESRVRVGHESPVDDVRKDILDKNLTATFYTSESIGTQSVMDREGNPVRSDFRAQLNAPTSMNWTETDQQNSVQAAVVTHAYMDLIYEGMATEQLIKSGHARMATEIYTPLMVITRVENVIHGDATMCHLAAGIAAVVVSHNAQRPYQHWMPSLFKKGQTNKVHDLAGIGYDLARLDPNFDPKKLKDSRLATERNTFDDLKAFQTLASVTRPNIALAYDARQIGDNSHIDMVLLEAACYQGDDASSQEACETIIRYFDAATNGHFSRLLGEARRSNGQLSALPLRDIIFANAGPDRMINIPYGFYFDTEGNRRDIREYTCTLPYLNQFGAQGDEILNEANDAFHRRGLTRGERQEKQHRLFELMINNNQYKLRGTHYRLLFNSVFLNIYAQALQASSTRIGVNDTILPNTQSQRTDIGAVYQNANFSGYGGIITNNMYGTGAVRQGSNFVVTGANAVGYF